MSGSAGLSIRPRLAFEAPQQLVEQRETFAGAMQHDLLGEVDEGLGNGEGGRRSLGFDRRRRGFEQIKLHRPHHRLRRHALGAQHPRGFRQPSKSISEARRTTRIRTGSTAPGRSATPSGRWRR
jgi:hypothetical protein